LLNSRRVRGPQRHDQQIRHRNISTLPIPATGMQRQHALAMPLALYDLPNWLFGLLISGGWVVVGLAGYLVFHRVCRVSFSSDEKALATALLAVVATVNSLLMAFAAITVWEDFGAADGAVLGEGITLVALGRDLEAFDSAQSRRAGDLLKAYARSVVDQEWPKMRAGQAKEASWAAFDAMFRAVGDMQPAQPREMVLMPEIWGRANELIKYRRARLYASDAHVPITLWAVVVVGTLITIVTTYVFPRTAFNLVAVGLLSWSLGLVFFFVAALDRPFVGKESIGPEPIEEALQAMER
jgi:hypothetical protein